MFLIGTDEAGYGPNLGPLVISMTIWEVPDALAERDLYDLTSDVVVRRSSDEDEAHVLIADSKQLYKPGGGLASLERGVLSISQMLGKPISTWREVWATLAPDSQAALAEPPWYASFDTPLPKDAQIDQIDGLERALTQKLSALSITLRSMQSVAVLPRLWNERLDAEQNKATILAHETLRLVQHGVASLPAGAIFIQCDKFGGRNRYSHLLQGLFPEYLVEIRQESRPLSIYRWGPVDARVECRFAAKGETFLPAALASMASKYLRELAMLAFNHYWRQQIPGLKATAGYPVDARRFKAEIEAEQKRLDIDDRMVWRQK